MRQVKFNINHFKIWNYKDGYKYFLHFLIRYFFSASDFSGRVSYSDFIKRWMEYWFSSITLKNIFHKGKIDNPFFHKVELVKWNEYLYLKSVNLKKKGSMLVYIQNSLLKKVRNLWDFRSLCYMLISSNIIFSPVSLKKREYITMQWRSLKTIWKSFWNVSKHTMSIRLHTAQKKFPKFFNITARYTSYNSFVIQINNLYSIKWVRYIYIIKKGKDIFPVKPQFIHSKKEIFWDFSKVKWFLPTQAYKYKK